jgi:hypothetical protein
VDDFLRWRDNPASYTPQQRVSSANKGKKKRDTEFDSSRAQVNSEDPMEQPAPNDPGSYQSAFPVRPGWVVTIVNLPHDLSKSEADRLAQFIRMLAAE